MKNIRIVRTGILALNCSVLAATVLAAPSVSSFSPTQGKPGTQVTINGADFSTATVVKFDTVVADFIVGSANQMVAVVPPDATTGKIQVTNPSGSGSSGSNFVVAPRISDFFPPRSATNTTITINGFNFTGATNVRFNNRTSVFAVTASTQIRATVPFGATNGPITVVTPVGAVVTVSNFVVTGPAPIIDEFSPRVGAPGTQVIINGANFTNLVAVRFNGVNSVNPAAPAHTQINAVVPATAPIGPGKITVVTSGGTAVSTNDFIVTRAPVITNFFPAFGKAGQTEVTIEGINFTSSPITGIGFSGKPVSGWGTPAPNQIVCTVPNNATNGPITITNAFGVAISANDFIVTRASIITGFEPSFAAPGVSVRIDGFNFTGVPSPGGVKFNGANAQSVAVTADTQIHAIIPANATTGPITVTNSFGAMTSGSHFTVIGAAPHVTEFMPGRGPRGTEVLITGKNFTSPATVRFNGVTDPTAAVTALTQIHATVPATTTGPITVTTGAGTSTNANIFYVSPRLAGFTPTNGVVGSGVVITGANYVGVTEVLFNTAAAAFTVNASNRLTAVVPTNATTGPLTISTPGGVVISMNNFRVLPNITGFSPTLGPVGTLVTITGTSFLNVTNVSFNNTSAVFTNVSSTEIRATVPFNATTGPIRVGTPDGTAVSSSNFVVTVGSDLVLTMTASTALMEPGQPLTYTLAITNTGPSSVTGVTVTNTLPAGVNFVSASSTRGSCAHNAGIVSCAIGTLTNATGFTITIEVVPPVEGVFVNTATVKSVEADPDTFDNTASVTTTVVSAATRTLSIGLVPGGSKVVISWPTSAVTFSLQLLNSLSSSNAWQPVTNTPAIVGNRNTVTNSTTNAQQFFRLRRP